MRWHESKGFPFVRQDFYIFCFIFVENIPRVSFCWRNKLLRGRQAWPCGFTGLASKDFMTYIRTDVVDEMLVALKAKDSFHSIMSMKIEKLLPTLWHDVDLKLYWSGREFLPWANAFTSISHFFFFFEICITPLEFIQALQ